MGPVARQRLFWPQTADRVPELLENALLGAGSAGHTRARLDGTEIQWFLAVLRFTSQGSTLMKVVDLYRGGPHTPGLTLLSNTSLRYKGKVE